MSLYKEVLTPIISCKILSDGIEINLSPDFNWRRAEESLYIGVANPDGPSHPSKMSEVVREKRMFSIVVNFPAHFVKESDELIVKGYYPLSSENKAQKIIPLVT